MNHSIAKKMLGWGSAALVFACAIPPALSQSYTLTLLPSDTVTPPYSYSATEINDSGAIVGSDSSDFGGVVWLSPASPPVVLPSPDIDNSSYAYAINASGQVAGGSALSILGLAWNWNGSAYAYTVLPDSSQAVGNAINASGFVAGSDDNYAAVWTWDGTQYSSNLIVAGDANGINSAGTVVGYTTSDTAFFSTWNGSSYSRATTLPSAGGSGAAAYAINDPGQIVGYSYIASADQPATLWNLVGGSYVATSLGTLGGPTSVAYAINASGQIVGSSTVNSNPSTPQHAFLYQDGVMYDLNALAGVESPLTLFSATGINSSGQIVGGALDTSGNLYGYLLDPTGGPTPTPTPSPTPTPTPSPTPSPTPTATPSPTPTPSATPTPSPTRAPTPTPRPSPTAAPSPSPGVTPTPTPTRVPTPTPRPSPTAAPSPSPGVTPTPTPTRAPTPTPRPRPGPTPTPS